MNLKELWKRLRGIILFGIFYFITFFFIESRDVPYHVIHTRFDDLIPFCKYFIVPYTIWFAYVASTVLYLGLGKNKLKEYNCFILNMILGMILFLLTSLIYPNGQDLRPVITSDDIFSRAVKMLYITDTPTNILPSLHVYASVACATALLRDIQFQKHPALRFGVLGLTVLICLSTMFLKQHSIVDVISAFACNALSYPLIYRWDAVLARQETRHRKPVPKRRAS